MFDTQLENRMERHLSVVTWVDNKMIREVKVEDPFHHTTVIHEWSLWDWFKMLFRGRRIEVRVHVRSDGVSQGRWFQRAIICDHCRRNRIDDPHHPPEHDHGYHHGDERWCEDCYYEKPIVPKTMGLCDGKNPSA